MKQNILIADSGSTKTDWAVNGQRLQTQGINPFHMDEGTIRQILQEELVRGLEKLFEKKLTIETIYFYGSGVRPELEAKMQQLLSETFPTARKVEAKSDLLGAARALCGRSEGIACILGTGANSCLYNGDEIEENTPALGYILGDEGSGANLGLRFLNSLYKNLLPTYIKEEFETRLNLTLPDVIRRIYKEPMANRFLASLSPFIANYRQEPAIHQLIVDGFGNFLRKNVAAYQRRDLPVSAVGSVSFYYKEEWLEALGKEGYAPGLVMRSPIDGLVQMEELG